MKTIIRCLLVVLTIIAVSTQSIAQWKQTGLDSLIVSGLAVSGTSLFAVTLNGGMGPSADYAGGVFLSTNNGVSWNSVKNGLPKDNMRALIVNGNYLYAGTATSGVYLSTNNGTIWTSVNNGLTNRSINAFAVIGTNLFVGTENGGVFLSTNNGTNWASVSTGFSNSDVYALAATDSFILAGCGNKLLRSTNNGNSWTVIDSINFSFWGAIVSSIVVIHENNEEYSLYYGIKYLTYQGVYGGVRYSSDNGVSWNEKSFSEGVSALTVISKEQGSKNIFVGCSTDGWGGGGGIYLSTNNGSSWIFDTTDLSGQAVNTFAVSDTNLFAGLHYGGVWRRPLSEMIPTSVKQSSFQLPERFSLSQNYPNPFNPSTTIEYNIPQQSQVTVKIFDLLGREVASLVNEKKDAGRYSVQWNAKDVSSGIYFYKLTSGNFIETKKMLVVK
jgi:hypothetical protein